ncbi:MAG: excinuclease ABC subunit UvrA [Salinivirgaceae bacterium]
MSIEMNYQIKSIGLGKNDKTLSVQIKKEFIPALKHLSLFSHAIIFYGEIDKSVVSHEVIKIVSIVEKSGKCEFERLSCKLQHIELIDIKPYFPCEDRVINAYYKERGDAISQTIVTTDVIPCGRVSKYRGDTFLILKVPYLINNLTDCTHIKVFWWFNKFDKPIYRKATECDPPYENAPRTGIFASRSPVRPNPIALTTVKIVELDYANNTIKTTGLDCFDNTPIIGIVPYNPKTDKKDDFFVPKWLEHWSGFLIEDNDDHELAEVQASPMEIIKKHQKEVNINAPTINLSVEKPKVSLKQAITVVGARQNNLKNLTVSIPHNKTTVVTGVSGSGKSSLVFDTIFAESQYRFFESNHSVQHSGLKQTGRPEFDAIYGLTPAIAVCQTNVNRNNRSTFGTTTGLYNLLRTMYATFGERHCPKCGKAIVPISEDLIVETLLNIKTNTSISINPYGLEQNAKIISTDHSLEYYSNLKEIVKDCLEKGFGAIEVTVNKEDRVILQTTQKCYDCNNSLFELTPATFSFNNPESYCPVCNGTGEIAEILAELIITKPNISILDNASPFWGDLRKFSKAPNANWMKGEILALAQSMKINLELPWNRLDEDFRNKALYGSSGEVFTFKYNNTNGRTGEITRPVEGAVNILKRLLASGTGADRIVELYTENQTCPACLGERLNKEARLVTVAGKRIPEVVNMSVLNLKKWVESLSEKIEVSKSNVVKPILMELYRLCDKFIQAGLAYISLNRNSSTLSGGELQRTRLVTQLISGITNVSYILDEPFTGLHQNDAEKLFPIINELKENGNTVIMVEHSKYVMLNADHIIDIGPGAGVFGGEIIAEGSPRQIIDNPKSQTGFYLCRNNAVPTKKNYSPNYKKLITINGARAHNLKNINISFPSGAIVCICGVSGSGKSSLVEDCLYPAINAEIAEKKLKYKHFDEIIGADIFSKVILVDQKPIGRNSRSNPATYTGAMDEIREIFSNTETAKRKGYKSNRFSFNNKEGQCNECNGNGVKRLNLPFLSDTEVECSCCKGLQFNRETLSVKYLNKNIAEVLQMSVDDALLFFNDNHKAKQILQTLHDIGLGYLKLGQNSSSVSGGEAQRIKLATSLCKSVKGDVLYILDEPSSGLHFNDVKNLMLILQKIVSRGNTVVMVEHNEEIIRYSDVVIELGPKGGEEGGYIIKQ